jgi:hypothetical protein
MRDNGIPDDDEAVEKTLRRIDRKVADMYPVVMTEIPKMNVMIQTAVNAQALMSAAADRMATTHAEAEVRFGKLEERLQEANDKAAGKNMMPIMSHYLVLGGTILILTLLVLYATQQTIEATLTSIEVRKEREIK